MNTNREPVTHTIDYNTLAANDPIDKGANALLQQVAQLNGQPQLIDDAARAVHVTPNRAAIYQDAVSPNTQQTQAPAQPTQQPTADPQQLDLSDPTAQENDLLGTFLEPQLKPNEQAPAPDVNAPDEVFSKQFEQHFGMKVDEARAMVQELQQFRVQQVVEQQFSQLQQVWQVPRTEAEARLAQVQERYNKLSDSVKNTLAQDQVRATQLIWQQLEKEQAQRYQQVPQFDRNGQPRPQQLPKGVLTKQQIYNMTESEYAARQPEIMAAYANGLVI
jgi:hypothetical protein